MIEVDPNPETEKKTKRLFEMGMSITASPSAGQFGSGNSIGWSPITPGYFQPMLPEW